LILDSGEKKEGEEYLSQQTTNLIRKEKSGPQEGRKREIKKKGKGVQRKDFVNRGKVG